MSVIAANSWRKIYINLEIQHNKNNGRFELINANCKELEIKMIKGLEKQKNEIINASCKEGKEQEIKMIIGLEEMKDEMQNVERKFEHCYDFSEMDPRKIICIICRIFYYKEWLTGTGGSISIKQDESLYVTPSGVMKEYIHPDNVFVLDTLGNIVKHACNAKLKPTQCLSLFKAIYDSRETAGCIIHSHSKWAVRVTTLGCTHYNNTTKLDEFQISHQEMIKGIEGHRYDSTLTIPVIDNANIESQLEQMLTMALIQYPTTIAVLVRRHGIYLWGRNVENAKNHAECLHYLFEEAVALKQMGMDLVLTAV